MGETNHYNLYITDDANEPFINWRRNVAGIEESNMQKIDSELFRIDSSAVVVFDGDDENDLPTPSQEYDGKIFVMKTPVLEGGYLCNKLWQCRQIDDGYEWKRVYTQYKIRAKDGSAFYLDENGDADVRKAANDMELGVMCADSRIGTYMLANGAMSALGYTAAQIDAILADAENPWRIGTFVSAFSLKDYVAAKAQKKPVTKTLHMSPMSWSPFTQGAYKYQATASVSGVTIGSDTTVELVNNNAVLFSEYGFAILSVSGQTITFGAVKSPSIAAGVDLEVEIYD